MTEDNDAKFWDWVSVKYDEIADEQTGKFLREATLKYLGREGNLGKAIEFGCGTGFYTEALAKAAVHVTAIDISEGMLCRARERFGSMKNITFRKEDCRRTSFPYSSFDTVFIGSVLNVMDDPARVIKEARRILKPGGTLLIVNPDWSLMNGYNRGRSTFRFLRAYGEALYMYPQTFRYLSKGDLNGLLAATGFRTVSVFVADNYLDSRNCALEYVKAVMLLDDVIKVERLGKRYGDLVALKDVSFSIRRGGIFALLGPNGAGKSTLAEILECRRTYTSGTMSVLGVDDLMADRARKTYGADKNYRFIRERIGVLPQGFSAFGALTVYENIDYFARMYPNHLDVDCIIEEFALGDKRDVQFKDLSGGLKQRVGIAIALVHDPDIVFMDEPTAGLDPASRRDVWAAIKTAKARGKTVILTTHYLDEAYLLADDVCILHRGSIVARGAPDEIIDRMGGENTLIIRECSHGATGALARALPGSKVEGSTVSVKVAGDQALESVEKAVEVLSSGQFSCRELFMKRPTLDDVFLKVTGETMIEGGM